MQRQRESPGNIPSVQDKVLQRMLFLIVFITILIEEEKSKLGSLPTSVSFVPFRELIHNLADTAS